MTARSVLKLLTKSCAYKLNSACPSPITSYLPEKDKKQVRLRSCSHQRYCKSHPLIRKMSRSVENFREIRIREEEDESSRQRFPGAIDVSERDPAREFRQINTVEEIQRDNSYELGEGSRSHENFYDVVGYMRKMETLKLQRMFMHLQPSNLKPFGSSENIHEPEGFKRKRIRIVYPRPRPVAEVKVVEREPEPEVVNVRATKEYPGYEETKRAAIFEARYNAASKMNYSTSCLKKKIVKSDEKRKLTFRTNVARHSSLSGLRKRDVKPKISQGEIFDVSMDKNQIFRRMSDIYVKSDMKLSKSKSNIVCTRKCNTQSKPTEVLCEDYVTVKLKELQEECGNTRKKVRKICFGRLPKLVPPNCPCYEDYPLKPGKPLNRLKKRFEVPDRNNSCSHIKQCEPNLRADWNYQVKPKTLRPIKVAECPCEEREMTDFVIKRLPKKKVAEPPKVCITCVGDECCPPRSDDGLSVEKRVLPKLKVNQCPCVEEPPLKDMTLKRLKPVRIEEPQRVCRVFKKCTNDRADANLVVKPKTLPPIKGDCVCVDPPQMDEGKPFRRLQKVKLKGPPHVCPPKCPNAAPRADRNLKPQKKKLPVFVPRSCPCIEPDAPGIDVKLKKLKPTHEPKEPERPKKVKKLCPRADDGMQIKPKVLPQIEVKECPCVEREVVDVPPLKKLVAKPVKEPEKVCKPRVDCSMPRSDAKLEVKRKNLPKLQPGNCPCVEKPPPLDVLPLKKLKKVVIEDPQKVCPVKEHCPQRADESLKVDIKQLPKLEIPDCPCYEPEPPLDVKPLKRLRKVFIPEPVKECPGNKLCDETPRADEDDWLYWKRVEVKPPECDPPKAKRNTRSFSTVARRFYSTTSQPSSNTFNLKYDLPQITKSTLKSETYNIIIDIKPSAPLVLSQTPVEFKCDTLESRQMLKRCHSEPANCVTFVIYKNNTFGQSKALKETSNDVALGFNRANRFISTCSTLCEHPIHRSQCPSNDRHLQPKNSMIEEKEHFIRTYPTDDTLRITSQKSQLYCRTREDDTAEEEGEERGEEQEEKNDCQEQRPGMVCQHGKQLSMWEKIVNYFKARPDCPSPEEFRKMKLKEDAEKAASKAGLCLYDPKEMLRKNEKDLPKVMTVDCKKDEK